MYGHQGQYLHALVFYPSLFAQIEFALQTYGCPGPQELDLHTCPLKLRIHANESVRKAVLSTKTQGFSVCRACLESFLAGDCQKLKAQGKAGGMRWTLITAIFTQCANIPQQVQPLPLLQHCITSAQDPAGPMSCVIFTCRATVCWSSTACLQVPHTGLGGGRSCPFHDPYDSFRHLPFMKLVPTVTSDRVESPLWLAPLWKRLCTLTDLLCQILLTLPPKSGSQCSLQWRDQHCTDQGTRMTEPASRVRLALGPSELRCDNENPFVDILTCLRA